MADPSRLLHRLDLPHIKTSNKAHDQTQVFAVQSRQDSLPGQRGRTVKTLPTSTTHADGVPLKAEQTTRKLHTIENNSPIPGLDFLNFMKFIAVTWQGGVKWDTKARVNWVTPLILFHGM